MMSDNKKMESWSSGNLYNAYMGKWSEQIAKQFIKWLQPSDNALWLDVGCGTGALTKTIVHQASPELIYGLDPSADFISEAKTFVQSPQVNFLVGSGTDIAFNNNHFDYAVSALALNFMPNPQTAIQEISRVTKENGIIALYVWDYIDKMEWLRYFWSSAVALDKSASQYDEGVRFPICQPDNLKALFESCNLKDIELASLSIPAYFETFEAYWELLNIGNFPAPAYLKSLSKEKQTELKAHLQEAVPTQPDGLIYMATRAWAIRGKLIQ